jgi:hypothetical protein
MRRHRDLGVQRKAVHAGTAGTGEGRAFALVAKPRAYAAHLLAGAFPKGNTLRHRSRHGAGQLRLVVPQRIVARGHGSVEASLQIPQLTQLTDDTPADRRDHGGDVGIAGGRDGDKPGCEALVRAIDIDAL